METQNQKNQFTLVVDNFGIKYTNKDDIDHLFAAIKDGYSLKIDWEGAKYVGIDLDWNYTKREVILSMKGYVERALKSNTYTQPNITMDQPNTNHQNMDRKNSTQQLTLHQN